MNKYISYALSFGIAASTLASCTENKSQKLKEETTLDFLEKKIARDTSGVNQEDKQSIAAFTDMIHNGVVAISTAEYKDHSYSWKESDVKGAILDKTTQDTLASFSYMKSVLSDKTSFDQTELTQITLSDKFKNSNKTFILTENTKDSEVPKSTFSFSP